MIVIILYHSGYFSAGDSIAGCGGTEVRINGPIDLSHLFMCQSLPLKVGM